MRSFSLGVGDRGKGSHTSRAQGIAVKGEREENPPRKAHAGGRCNMKGASLRWGGGSSSWGGRKP